MKHAALTFDTGFRVVAGNARSQAAEMTLEPWQTEGGPDNRHKGADQWLFVMAGTGVAVVEGEQIALTAGTIVLIEQGEAHEIRNTGSLPLKTINVYLPPAYDEQGDELPAVKGT